MLKVWGRRLVFILLIILLIILVVAGIFVGYGRENSWRAIAGPADQGPVDFKTLVRGNKPNQFILCPDDFCAAKVDGTAPVFSQDVETVRKALTDIILAEDRTEQVENDPENPRDRFVQRTNLMRYPDTVSIEYVSLDKGTSLAIYSRSQIGYSDRGVNRRRVQRWMKKLTAKLGS